MADGDVDVTLLRQAFRYLLEQGAPIELMSEEEVPSFAFEGRPVNASQVILKAYAAGMVGADHACAVGNSLTWVV